MQYEMRIKGLAMDQKSNTPIIILEGVEDINQTLPIWIGLLEATSIASVLQNMTFPRPMTHDLFKNFLDFIHISVDKIEISELKDNTFFAKIHFNSENHAFVMDARPSDAIALALRFNATIFVDESVIEMSQSPTEEKGKSSDADAELMDQSEEGKKWAEYLKNLSPDQFGKV